MSGPQGPIKYRASCDGCYLAKLKCSKEKPTCPRCKNLGLACTYSPSQRTGKHRATKSQASSSCSTTTATTLATTPSATSPAQVLAWQPAVSSSPPASAILPTETLANPFDKHPFPPKNDLSLTLMDTPMSDWSGSATTLPDLDSNLLAPWRNYLPNADQDDFQFDVFEDFPSIIPPAPDQKQPLGAPPPPPPPSSHTTTSCNCFASITQALHELHAQSRRPNRTPALEATLSGSKEVTARGEQLLRCCGGVCASDGSLIMLFAALLSKYLSLYAANTTDLIVSSSSPSSSTTPSSSSITSSPQSSSSCCADVFPSRVTIGTYTMDVEDGERLRMEIVLMELQKLNALLGKFRGKVACSSSSSSSSSSCVGVDVAVYEGHTYETVLDFLNTRLKEAMNRLQRQKQRFQAPAS